MIESLGLSKLTHVALVCPHMDEKQMEELEKMSFKFLWKDKPDRIRRVVAMLATEKGGLNMVDIKAFWDSLKLSWSRRFLTSSGVWQKILQLNLLRENFEMKDIWYVGPSFVKRISHHMTNIFWRHTIQAIQKLQQKTPYNYPHFFYLYDNEFFAVGGVELKRYDFPLLLDQQAYQVGDYYNLNTRPPSLLTNVELNQKYGRKIDFLSYHRIKTALIGAS